jgi:hypothetical protein
MFYAMIVICLSSEPGLGGPRRAVPLPQDRIRADRPKRCHGADRLFGRRGKADKIAGGLEFLDGAKVRPRQDGCGRCVPGTCRPAAVASAGMARAPASIVAPIFIL